MVAIASLESEIFVYLDELRESSKVNMFGAAPYIMEQFGISKQEAQEYLSAWMYQ